LPGSTIGVMGSGQLGRMFAIAARRIWSGLQNANMPKPTHGREKVRSQVEAHAKTAQPVASVMPVGS
jgi:phosphoribosylaminoimidazole carboxylase (NCAIR synthetase)